MMRVEERTALEISADAFINFIEKDSILMMVMKEEDTAVNGAIVMKNLENETSDESKILKIGAKAFSLGLINLEEFPECIKMLWNASISYKGAMDLDELLTFPENMFKEEFSILQLQYSKTWKQVNHAYLPAFVHYDRTDKLQNVRCYI